MNQKKIIKIIYIFFLVIIFFYLILLLINQLIVPYSLNIFDECNVSEYAISENEIYHHTLPPCVRYVEKKSDNYNGTYYARQDYSTKVRINSLGFRNDEYTIKKEENTYRIIILGDSYVYGYGLNLHETFFKKLEKKLNKNSDINYEVWNIGVPSWSTIIQYLVIKNKILEYSPDNVIIMFDQSDLFDNVLYQEQAIFNSSELIAIVELKYKGMDYYNRRSEINDVLWKNRKTKKGKDDIRRIQGFTVDYLKKISQILNSNGIRYEIVTYPYFEKDNSFEQIFYSNIYKELELEDIEYISFYKDLVGKEDYYSEIHKHWNSKGSSYVANILYNYIIEKT